MVTKNAEKSANSGTHPECSECLCKRAYRQRVFLYVYGNSYLEIASPINAETAD